MSDQVTHTTMPMIDPERIADRIFGGPYFCDMQIITSEDRPLLRHPVSGNVYHPAECSRAWVESRNARPVVYAGRDAGVAWPNW
jgi:hypothetical protein